MEMEGGRRAIKRRGGEEMRREETEEWKGRDGRRSEETGQNGRE